MHSAATCSADLCGTLSLTYMPCHRLSHGFQVCARACHGCGCRVAPELVVEAQLAALQRGDIFGASCFNIWRTHSSGFGLGIHYELMRDKLAQAPYDVLLHHSEAYLGAAALPSQRVMLQEVVVLGGGPGGGGSRGGAGGVRFLWRMGMQANGCWMVTGISVVDTY